MMPDKNWELEYWRLQKRLREAAKERAKKPPPDNAESKPKVRVTHFTNEQEFVARIKGVGSLISYIGIPPEGMEARKAAVKARSKKFTSARAGKVKIKGKLKKISGLSNLSNAYLLFMFSKGSPLTNQPPRPVLEPAIQAPWNRKEIADLVAKSIQAELAGQHYRSKKLLTSAGARAAKAARDWFEDPRNGWAPNAPMTIANKGFDKPGILTSIMKNAITHIEKPAPAGSIPAVKALK